MTKHAFQAYLAKVELSTGDSLILPRLTLKRTLGLTEPFSRVVVALRKSMPEIFDMEKLQAGMLSINSDTLMAHLPAILPIVYEEIVSVLCLYLDKDREWIDETFDLEDMLKVCIPLFGSIISQGTVLANTLAKAVEDLSKRLPTETQEIVPTESNMPNSSTVQ